MKKPRSSYPDHTRKLRTGRRNAILNAAAVRMNAGTWQKFSTSVREAIESAETDNEAAENLRNLLLSASQSISGGPRDWPPADMLAILAAYPPRKAGRHKQN
jgi:hypothetical protein